MANYKLIVNTIQEKEGGVSNAKTDAASSYPSPCTYEGKSNIHTNKGITWQTFVDSSKTMGFSADCTTFIKMPEEVWGSIFKKDFWDRYDLDLYQSQAIADFIAYTAFHFGVTGSRRVLIGLFGSLGYNVDGKNTIREAVNKILQSNSESWLLDKMFAYLESYYKSSSQTQNIQGWLNALEKFKPYAYSHLKATTKEDKKIVDEAKKNIENSGLDKKTLIIVGSITIALIVGVWSYYYITKKNKK